MHSIYSKTLAVVTILFLVGVIGCSKQEDYIPEVIKEQKLTKKITGEEAKGYVDHLHTGKVAAEKNEIGIYEGDRGKTTIYVSYYHSSQEAEEEGRKMTEKISPENSVFVGGQNIDIDGKQVYRCFGMGQTHFVFTHKKQLIWISVNTVVANKFLSEYLNYLNS